MTIRALELDRGMTLKSFGTVRKVVASCNSHGDSRIRIFFFGDAPDLIVAPERIFEAEIPASERAARSGKRMKQIRAGNGDEYREVLRKLRLP